MNTKRITAVLIFFTSLVGFNLAANAQDAAPVEPSTISWVEGGDVELFWAQYAKSKGKAHWGQSTSYPEYSKVKEGDTFLVVLEQGPCLMEFFHNRWRRANDVRRWSDNMNEFGGCPKVFD